MRGRQRGGILVRVNVRIQYEIFYAYERAVNFSPHELRIIPRSDAFARLLELRFETQPEARLRFHRDLFDNVVASFSFPAASEKLELKMTADVEIEPKNPFDFILAPAAVDLPFCYAKELAGLLRVYSRRQSRGLITLPGWNAPTETAPRGAVETLVALIRAIQRTISYERREQGPARAPAETVRRKRGACRDVAVLLAEILRGLGLAPRIVSGYLQEGNASTVRAERSLHAWTEVFLPGAGWVGLDPTNGIFCDENFIATAVGLRPAHVMPICGSFYHPERVPAQMTSRVELINLSPATAACADAQ
jgi:transglutaminase-like putative cysteine protease